MEAVIDHVVVWVEDPLRSMEFYGDVLGFAAVRLEEFERGEAPFPSVRVSKRTILDLMPRAGAPFVDALTNAPDSSGHMLNHLCFALGTPDFRGLRERLAARGVPEKALTNSFGAQGVAPETIYFRDPDGNVLEARHYG